MSESYNAAEGREECNNLPVKVLSTSDAGGDLLVAVDRMVLSGRRVFGWGWAAHQRRAVRSVRLRVEGDSWQARLPGGFGLWRRDVEESHPELVNARTSGFVLTGYAPEANAKRLYLELELEDGTLAETEVTEAVDKRDSRRNKLRLFAWLARSIWRRAMRGDFAGLARRAKAQSYAARPLDQMEVLEDMLRASSGSRPACLVIDNNMGGGSNDYRRSMIAARLAAGQAMLLCTYNLPILEYRVHLYRPGHGEQVFRIPSFLPLERLLRTGLIAELFVNSPVSFDEPLILAEWLARMRVEHPGVRLTVTAHDYFTVCPSFVLLNADGRFCGVPDLSECAKCLQRHQGSLVALSPRTEIGPWRALWGRCLQSADEVRCFSEETRRLLARAYPALDPARLSVVPHAVEFAPARAPRMDHRAPLVIGIVGDISFQKGAQLVQDLVDLVDRGHPDVPWWN